MTNKNPNTNLAVKAIRNASRLLMRDFLETRLLLSSTKGSESFAQRARERAESAIVDELQEVRPHYGIESRLRGEEPGSDPTRYWVINAVDGFTNYRQGLPHWVMTIALIHKENPVLAVIFNPLENELITAETGMGSWMNNTRIRTAQKKRLSKFTVATTLRTIDTDHAPQLARLEHVTQSVANVRVLGSASLDLVNVSCGRLDACWDEHKSPSSLPAANMILSEAGGLIAPLSDTNQGLVAAGNTGFSLISSLLVGDDRP